MVELEPPWTHLAAGLGIEVDQQVIDAVRAEMGYYREHAHEGTDERALAELRARCAAILSDRLDRDVDVETMMGSIRFRAFDDAAPALAGLRDRGLRLVCLSNWDVSLTDVLERVGLLDLLDGVVTSAGTGARKPDPAIFERALELAGCTASEALHVGDSTAEDVAGAQAAGIPALLIDRDGGGDIASLTEIDEHLRP